MSAAGVSIVIPTFRRPASLARAVRSVYRQDPPAGVPVALVIVDNDPDASAAGVLATLRAEAPDWIAFTAVSEPRAGVANARNAAMAVVRTPLVAFLDDDQSAPPGWLGALLNAHGARPAAVTFGPVLTALPGGVSHHRRYLEAFFARAPAHESGYIDTWYGCGNALLDLTLAPQDGPLFDARMNASGGEDDLLYARIDEMGGRFAWCAEAPVFEHVPESRAQLGYTLRRAIAYGQGPCNIARRQSPPRVATIAFWMAVGLGQGLVYGSVAAAAALLRLDGRAFWYDRAARGFGKVWWWRGFEFYGTAALAPEREAKREGTSAGVPASGREAVSEPGV